MDHKPFKAWTKFIVSFSPKRKLIHITHSSFEWLFVIAIDSAMTMLRALFAHVIRIIYLFNVVISGVSTMSEHTNAESNQIYIAH